MRKLLLCLSVALCLTGCPPDNGGDASPLDICIWESEIDQRSMIIIPGTMPDGETLRDGTCGDGFDNDCDGQFDEDCGEELCGDGFDNDADGMIDEGCSTPTQVETPTSTPADPTASSTLLPTESPAPTPTPADPTFTSTSTPVVPTATPTAILCPDADGDGFTTCDGDCADSDYWINPGIPDECDGIDNNCDGVEDEAPDEDGDGFTTCRDCDDEDPNINPDAPEACDHIDNNCDGSIDIAADQFPDALPIYWDIDADGYASDDSDPLGWTCEDSEFMQNPPGFYTTVTGDCNEGDPQINPEAEEVCDSVDNDCNGQIDEGFDTDGDGVSTCAGDCNDDDPRFFPGAPETDCTDSNDYNCDGQVGYTDEDGDGFAACQECDDENADVNPEAVEICDNVDNNCDGFTDEGFDEDGDSWTTCEGDCRDFDADDYPGAIETCDGVDEDCDGTVDEGVDADGDDYEVCFDCDDSNPDMNPEEEEVCDGIDNDCDGDVDEEPGVCPTPTMTPEPTPTFESTSTPTATPTPEPTDTPTQEPTPAPTSTPTDEPTLTPEPTATPPVATPTPDSTPTFEPTPTCSDVDNDGDGYSHCEGDCNDDNRGINPGAEELCDGVDGDCDGEIDEDSDGDGYPLCEDCDDSNPDINPYADEVCDLVDNDCDTAVDEGVKTRYYEDADEDEYGSMTSFIRACSLPDGYVENSLDCDDSSDTAYPGGYEAFYDIDEPGSGLLYCSDGLDNDCNGLVDDKDAVCQDEDNDGLPDGIDYLFPCDPNGDGDNEAACIWAEMAWDSPWSRNECVQQQRPYTDLSLDDDVNDIVTVNWAGKQVDVCPIYPTEVGSGQDWSAVSLLAADGEADVSAGDCQTWERMNLDNYCLEWGDTLCTNASSQSDGCESVGYALSFSFNGVNVTP